MKPAKQGVSCGTPAGKGEAVAKRAKRSANSDQSGWTDQQKQWLDDRVLDWQKTFKKKTVLQRIASASRAAVKPEQIARVVLTTMRNDNQLMQCDRSSVLSSVVTALGLGLEPDNVSGLAYLVPFKKNKGTSQETIICTLIVGYRGFVQLALRSNQVADLCVRCVYEGDEFDIDYGRTPPVIHKPLRAPDAERILVAAYSSATVIVGGATVRTDAKAFMWAREIAEHRQRYSPNWNSAKILKGGDALKIYAEKTLARMTCKWLPSSPVLQRAVSLDEQVEGGMRQDLDWFDIDDEDNGAPKTDTEIADSMTKRTNDDKKETRTQGSAPDSGGVPANAQAGT